jgi:hypothetical protein
MCLVTGCGCSKTLFPTQTVYRLNNDKTRGVLPVIHSSPCQVIKLTIIADCVEKNFRREIIGKNGLFDEKPLRWPRLMRQVRWKYLQFQDPCVTLHLVRVTRSIWANFVTGMKIDTLTKKKWNKLPNTISNIWTIVSNNLRFPQVVMNLQHHLVTVPWPD